MPEYVIEPPDILLIDAVRVIPLPPYKIEPLDYLFIQAVTLPGTEAISGVYPVETDGTVSLGPTYGAVQVSGLTIPQAFEAIDKQLKAKIKEPQTNVSLGASHALQQIRGEHLVRPDGTISLGTYGSVRVVGMTMTEARAAIEAHLSQSLLNPQISLDVAVYNSKVFYVILDGGGNGQSVIRLPITGNETVLDAISQVFGLSAVSSKHHMRLARPAPACSEKDQVLAVDWVGITTRGRTETNFQLMPGDRLYVQADPVVTFDTYLGRIVAPFERAFGFTLLGTGTIFNVEAQTAGGTFSKGGGGAGGGAGGGF